jgi:formate hydrogenlyase subunit 3/multisubunit Na+/H+ antiporter MnhD subunit
MIWIAVIFFPLLLAALLSLSRINPVICRHGLWMACVPACLLAVMGTDASPGQYYFLFLGTSLHFGQFGRVFLFLTTSLWAASGLFACGSLQGSDRRKSNRFSLFFLLTLCGNIGLCLAQDLASFYVFFAVMSFSAYGLIIHDGTRQARRAARIYLIMTVLGEVFLAASFFYASLTTPLMKNLAFSQVIPALGNHPCKSVVMVLAYLGFGVKAGALGLHVWLPLAHPAAPIPASAVLSGAMIKAGLLGWLHIFHAPQPQGWGIILAWAGLCAAVYGVLAGVRRHDPKTILAYSSISQMGLMTMALGFFVIAGETDGREVLSGLLFFVLVHGLAKGSLFLGVGPALAAGRNTLRGHLVLAGLVLASLTLAGLPLSAGGVVKQGLKQGVLFVPGPLSGFFTFMLGVTATGTMLLLAVFMYRVWSRMPERTRQTSGMTTAAWIALVLLVVLAESLGRMLPSIHILDVGPGPSQVISGVWPIVLGIVLAVFFLKSPWGRHEPSGLDNLFLDQMARLFQWFGQKWLTGHYCNPSCGRVNVEGWANQLLETPWMLTVPDRLEKHLLYWHTAGALFLILLLLFIVLIR